MIATDHAVAQSSFDTNDIRAVQQKLAGEGYEVGKIDGRLSTETEKGIQQYQEDWQLPITGKISVELIERLDRTHPATRPQWQTTENKNCDTWNSLPQPNETVTWTAECADGKTNGSGKRIWRFFKQGMPRETVYVGQLRDGKRDGQGVLVLNDGFRYEGGYRDDEWHGQGTATWANGNRYEGEWRNNKAHGQGTFAWANGDRYEGEYRDGKKHGQGVFTGAAGARFQGEYRDDKAHGLGVFTWANGDRFEGEFRDYMRHGHGVFTWAEGNRYEGKYRHDKPHGRGGYYNKSRDQTYSGQWRRGCLTANGENWALHTPFESCGF